MVTLLAFSFSSCNGKLALFINAKSGDSYKYHVALNQTTNVEYGEETSKNNQNMVTDFIITVDDVDSEGNLAMSYKYDAIRIDSESDGNKQTIDSNNADDDDPVSKLYNSFIGKGFSVKMNKFGEVNEVSGVDELFDSMIASMGIDENESTQALMETMKEGLKDSYGDQALKSTIEQSTRVFPQTENIKVGDSWTVDNSFKSIMNIDMQITYTLEKVEGDVAHISVKSDIETDDSKTDDYMGMVMSADLSGKMTGTIKVNISNGFLSEGEIEQEISGKMNLMVPETEGGEGQSIELPMSFTTKATYSTTKM
jgi:hypothetical protein